MLSGVSIPKELSVFKMPELTRGSTMKDKVGILDNDLFKVHKLEQVFFPEDYNLPSSQFKKIKKFLLK